MKTVGLRTLYQVAGSLTEEVLVTQGRAVIGKYTPFTLETVSNMDMGEIWDHLEKVPDFKETSMAEEPVKKAIEPDKVRGVNNKPGKLSKGLGPLPGEDPQDQAFKEFRPAPKPGKGKK
jgi:hypothetical protein